MRPTVSGTSVSRSVWTAWRLAWLAPLPVSGRLTAAAVCPAFQVIPNGGGGGPGGGGRGSPRGGPPGGGAGPRAGGRGAKGGGGARAGGGGGGAGEGRADG